jgi:hypothetical protein
MNVKNLSVDDRRSSALIVDLCYGPSGSLMVSLCLPILFFLVVNVNHFYLLVAKRELSKFT